MVERLKPECITCLLNKYLKTLPINLSDSKKLGYVQGILKIIGDADVYKSAPEIVEQIDDFKRKFGIFSEFSDIKIHYNNFMLSLENGIENEIEKSSDKLKRAICYAMAGNYIDFGAMDSVSEDELLKTLDDSKNINLNQAELERFKSDISNAEKIVYLLDNCGEIVLDKLLIKQIIEFNPNVKIDVIVRGRPVLNDCTIEDAKAVGLCELVKVTDNGTGVAGTALDKISAESKNLINNADVIISKGQGNFETLYNSGENIYYLFMCKCKMFAKRFCVEQFTGMFINDLRI